MIKQFVYMYVQGKQAAEIKFLSNLSVIEVALKSDITSFVLLIVTCSPVWHVWGNPQQSVWEKIKPNII